MSATGAARRTVLVAAIAAAVVIALGVSLFVVFVGGDDEEPPPPAKPLEIAAPKTIDDVFSVSGQPAELRRRDVRAVVATVKGYLQAATITPLEEREGPRVARFFAGPAAERLKSKDRFALADAHLPRAEHGVSTERAKLGLAAIVDDAGAGQLVAATINVRMVVRLEDDSIVVNRSGDMVLQPAADGWRISAYHVRAKRTFASETTTTEAAFG